jgi:hypothetical protein
MPSSSPNACIVTNTSTDFAAGGIYTHSIELKSNGPWPQPSGNDGVEYLQALFLHCASHDQLVQMINACATKRLNP